MSTVERYLARPHLITSLVLLAAVVGFVGYRHMPVNLFPGFRAAADRRGDGLSGRVGGGCRIRSQPHH